MSSELKEKILKYFYFPSNVYFDSYAAKFFEKNIHAQKTDNNDEKPPNKRYKYTITGWLIFFGFK